MSALRALRFATPKKASKWDLSQRRLYLDDLAEHLKIRRWEDWYEVSKRDFQFKNGLSLLNRFYSGSPSKAITSIYYEHPWKTFKFQHLSQSHWSDGVHQVQQVKHLESEVNIKKWDDWYCVSTMEVANKGGHKLLQHFGGSLSKMLASVYPQHPWDVERFEAHRVPAHHFSDINKQRDFAENKLAKRLDIRNYEDWYHVTFEQMIQNGGGTLLSMYGNSCVKAITSIFSEYPWQRWKFANGRLHEYWSSPDNLRRFTDYIKARQGVSAVSDWKVVTANLVRRHGGNGILERYGSFANALKAAYPDQSFEESQNVSVPQGRLTAVVKKLFSLGDEDIRVNYRHPLLLHKSGANMELDLWIEFFNLAFEYQGEQHFKKVFDSVDAKQTERDAEKRAACTSSNIILIEVPFWWDGSEAQLISVLLQKCPALVSPSLKTEVSLNLSEVPLHLQRAESLQSTRDWSSQSCETKGWLMAEKLEGVAVHWDGTELFSGDGRKIQVPREFLGSLPKGFAVDGELSEKRGQYPVFYLRDAPDLSVEQLAKNS
eukprot:TRINITY_DN1993_c0_g1_i1.p1 TRINITY_DN1993_c0_g1~~TRINITY_DN1993_c0_g1_i1.p1  ORF type:complete len:544 (+),score=104.71 TRINITY_DN1993_c0_g1_i1:59-1690(+)